MPSAPQPLESPAVRRSKYLADLLARTQQAPDQIRSGGELGARLLAQGIAQWGANRAEKAVETEAATATERQRAALAAALGGAGQPTPITPQGPSLAQGLAPEGPGNSLTPVQSPVAPIAPVEASPLAPAMPAQPQAPMAVPAPMPAQQAPQQPQVPPALANRIQQLAATDLPAAQAMLDNFLNQQAQMSTLPPEIANDPRMAYLAATNPEAFTAALSEQYAPQVIAQGGIQSIVGTGQQVRNPMTREFGLNLVRDTPDGVETVATRGPNPTEQAALQNAASNQVQVNRPQAVSTGTGVDTRLIGPSGEVISEFSGRSAPTTPPAASLEIQGRIDSASRDVLPTTSRMRSILQSGDIITGFGANARLDAARALAALGNQDAQRQVAATQEYQNLSGQLRVGLAKSLGANPSNADIVLLEKITAGDIGQSPEALLATIDQADQRTNGLIQDLTRQVGSQAQPQGAVPPLPPGFRLD